LSDIVESYIGALFIDSSFSYTAVQTFFDANILPFFKDMSIYDTFANNHPTTLLHHTLSQIYNCQAYQLLVETVDSNVIGGKPKVMAGLMVHKELAASVVGESGRYAKERVSKKANEELRGLTVKEFRAQYGCDCQTEEDVVIQAEKSTGLVC
jgi:endoribonuclease Dicer